uniref:NADH dehydrogenase subunit 6 n=1 Tax=Ismarus sp. ZJUH_2016020 TaxID=2491162 RepID=A0A3S8V0X3_9HYME|nr:NADH dehydrogenase subunit 6 [Ismarus sp. ZJUH_2016020]
MLNFIYYFMNFSMLIIILLASNSIFNNPLFIGSMLFMFNINLVMILNLSLNSSWYSMLLFLIMIGGMMILFIYFTSLSSNSNLMINYNFFKNLIMKIFFLLIIFYIFNINIKNNEMINMNYFMKNNYFMKENISATKMFIFPNNLLSIFSIMYLWFCLSCIVKICFKVKFPMRKLI